MEDKTFEQALNEVIEKKYSLLIEAIDIVSHAKGISKKDALEWIFRVLDEGKSIRIETREVNKDEQEG